MSAKVLDSQICTTCPQEELKAKDKHAMYVCMYFTLSKLHMHTRVNKKKEGGTETT